MQETSNDFEELQQTDFPAFPVVFRPDPEESQSNNFTIAKSRVSKGPFKLPEAEIQNLQSFINNPHNSTYNQLFKESWENGLHNIDNFFSIYRPLDEEFIQQMKTIRQGLKIVRLSSHKMYIGQFKDGQCTGKSIVIFKNGNIYEGMMYNNKRNGNGFYLQAGVGWFQGTFNNDIKTGQGKEVVYQKWAFKGQFLNGLRHEKGLYVENNGIVYHGIWKLGIMHGKGILRTLHSSYNGILVNSLKHGQGEEKFSNGDAYKGEYQNNRFDGFGTYNWKQGEATYEGIFKNGLRHGKGKWSSGETKYSGNYAEGLKQGYGELYFPSGNFYKGNFINDKREGYGQMFWTDGSFYKGDWKNGVQNGKGQIYLAGGQIISGLFENSILVQIIPSIYEKQMESSNMAIQDLFGSNPKLPTTNKTRTFSESKQLSHHGKKKLTKIEETQRKKSSIKDHIFFQTPNKTSQPVHNINHTPTHNIQNTTGFPKRQQNQAKSPLNRQLHSHDHRHSHGQSGDGHDCKCMRRLQNFRMRQRIKTKMNESKVEQSFHHSNQHNEEN